MKIFILVLAMLFPFSLFADQRGTEQVIGEQIPAITIQTLKNRSTLLCFQQYTVLYSGVSKTPLWSAEYLTKKRINNAKKQVRVNSFHEEKLVPPADRSLLADYYKSGFDRGHMAPSGDMPDAISQNESFSLSNMIPQNQNVNRGVWEGIEREVRFIAVNSGEVYVVTGPIFPDKQNVNLLNGRIHIPSGMFKAVYIPKTNKASAYITNNSDDDNTQIITIVNLTKLIGIDVFPALPIDVKTTIVALPRP